MINKLLLNMFTGDVFVEKVKNNSRKCIRNKNEKDKCTRCVDMCPEEAISTSKDCVHIDPILCTACNLCVSACYSRNFSSDKFPYLKATNSILEKDSTVLSCMKTSKQDSINFGCLRTIDKRYLYAYNYSDIDHNLKLDLSKCQGCQYEDISDMSYIEDLDREYEDSKSKIIIINEESDYIPESRRDFLNRLGKGLDSVKETTVKEALASLEKLGLAKTDVEDVDIFIKLFVNKALNKSISLDKAKDIIYELSIGPTCTLCRKCINSCPKGALSINTTDDYEEIILDQKLCNYCDRCIEVCEFDSISKTPINNMDKKQVFKKHYRTCKACKIKATELRDNGLCNTCHIRKNKKNKLRLV